MNRSPLLTLFFFVFGPPACSGGSLPVVGNAAEAGLSSDAASAPDVRAPLEVKLTVPAGTLTGCDVTTVNTMPNLQGTAGGAGTITLAVDGSGQVSADLAFGQWLTTTLALVPTGSGTAAQAPGSFVATETYLTLSSQATGDVPVSASFLAVVGDQLFVSLHGASSATTLDGYAECPVPAGFPRTTVVTPAPPSAPFPNGTFSSCTSSISIGWPGTESGGDSLRTVSLTGGVLTADAVGDAGYPIACANLAFQDLSTSAATLTPGASCTLSMPCGPPPSLGPNNQPTSAALTGMQGAMAVVGGTLFLTVTGDAGAAACGSHFVSLVCPVGP